MPPLKKSPLILDGPKLIDAILGMKSTAGVLTEEKVQGPNFTFYATLTRFFFVLVFGIPS